MNRTRLDIPVAVEGRDDVSAVSKAFDALIIPTHGFGITQETWNVIEKAYNEKGLIILTDPDYSGEEIRRKLTERFPDAVQAYVAREDATAGDDIGVENASPETIQKAIERALELAGRKAAADAEEEYAGASDLARLGLSGGESSAKRRYAVCRELGIGQCNAKAMVKKLRGFGIGRDELEKACSKIGK